MVITNITLYAKWKEIYTVTFNSNGGTDVASQNIAEGEKAVNPQPAPTREGYYFGGWYTDNSLFANKWEFDTDVVTADIILYAKWGTIKLLETMTMYSRSWDHGPDDDFERYYKYIFEYDEQNRITKMSRYDYEDKLSWTNTYRYSGDDVVQDNTYDYTKSGNTITQKNIVSGKIYIIELNSDELPVKRVEEQPGLYPNVEFFEYQDGNLTKKRDRVLLPEYNYEEWEDYTYTYYYDNEKGALYHCKTPKWYLIMYLNDFGVSNNIDEGGHLFVPYSVYTYEYDDDGFPAKRTSITYYHMFDSEEIEEYTYITK